MRAAWRCERCNRLVDVPPARMHPASVCHTAIVLARHASQFACCRCSALLSAPHLSSARLQVFTIGGSWSGGLDNVKVAEVFNKDTGWRRLPGIDPTVIYTDDSRGIYRSDNHAWLFGWRDNESAPQDTLRSTVIVCAWVECGW